MPKTIIARMQENPENYKRKKSPARKKKMRFKKIALKITDTQMDALDHYCKIQKTTPVRFLKSMISKHSARYKNQAAPTTYITQNQLQLFDFED